MTAVLIVGVPVGVAVLGGFAAAVALWAAAITVMHRYVSRLAGSPA